MGVRYFWWLNLRAALLLLQSLSFFWYEWCEEPRQCTNHALLRCLVIRMMVGDRATRTSQADLLGGFYTVRVRQFHGSC